MFQAVSNASGVSRSVAGEKLASHKVCSFNVLATVAELRYQADYLTNNTPLDYSGVTGTAIRDFRIRPERMPGIAETRTGETRQRNHDDQGSGQQADYLTNDTPLDLSGVTGTAIRDFRTRSERMPGIAETRTGETRQRNHDDQGSGQQADYLTNNTPLDLSGVTGTAIRDFRTRSERMPGIAETRTGETRQRNHDDQGSGQQADYLTNNTPLDYSGVTGTAIRDFRTRSERMPGIAETRTGETRQRNHDDQGSGQQTDYLTNDTPLDLSGVTGTAIRDFRTRSERMPGIAETWTGETRQRNHDDQGSGQQADYLTNDTPLDLSGVTGTAIRDFHTRPERMPGIAETRTGETRQRNHDDQGSGQQADYLTNDTPLDLSGVTGTAIRDFHTRPERMPGIAETRTGETGLRSHDDQQSGQQADYLTNDTPLDFSGVTGTAIRDFRTRSERMPGIAETRTDETSQRSHDDQQSGQQADYLTNDTPLDFSGVTGAAIRDFRTRSERMPGIAETRTGETSQRSHDDQQSGQQADYLTNDTPLDFSGVTGAAIRDFRTRSERMPGIAETRTGETSLRSHDDQQSGLMTAGLPNSRNNKHECDICYKTFAVSYKLKRHKKIHGEMVSCPLCFKKYKNRPVLDSHIIEQHTERKTSYVCGYCQKKFPFICRLERHYPSHNPSAFFQCESCPQRFYVKESLQKHIDAVHRSKDKDKDNCSYKCSECNKIFNHKSALCKHKSKVHRTKNHIKCEFCDKLFARKRDLGDHTLQAHTYMITTRALPKTKQQPEKRETGDNPGTSRLTPIADQPSTSGTQTDSSRAEPKSRNYCSECSMHFGKGPDFRQHNIDKHNAPAPYQCKYCQRGFSVRSYLEQHKFRDHKDQVKGRHNCNYCGEKFWMKAVHDRHIMARHPEKFTGKQYKCNYCNSVFIDDIKFRQHIIRKHADKKISESVCNHCGKQFVYLSLLLRHQKTLCSKKIGKTMEGSATKKTHKTAKKKTREAAKKKTHEAAKKKTHEAAKKKTHEAAKKKTRGAAKKKTRGAAKKKACGAVTKKTGYALV